MKVNKKVTVMIMVKGFTDVFWLHLVVSMSAFLHGSNAYLQCFTDANMSKKGQLSRAKLGLPTMKFQELYTSQKKKKKADGWQTCSWYLNFGFTGAHW